MLFDPPLPPDALRRRSDLSALGFETTDDLPDLDTSFGQARAEQAIRFGIGLRRPGYHLFVLGPEGSGRHTTVRRLLHEDAAQRPRPDDWCYVNNFADADRPCPLRLPAGLGGALTADLQQFASELGPAIESTLEGDTYRAQVDALNAELKERQATALSQLGDESTPHGIALVHTPRGFAFLPVKDGETMSVDAFHALPQAEREHLEAAIDTFSERLHRLLEQFPRWQRELQAGIRQATQQAIELAVGHLIEELRDKYAALPKVLAFLEAVRRDVITTGGNLREQERSEGETVNLSISGHIQTLRYEVNLLVDNGTLQTAPVVEEDNPNYQNLVGRVDQVAHMGTLLTNFTMIRAGALHRANGGYLLLDALRVLSQPYAWEGLKRSLHGGQIRIESLGQAFGYTGPYTLEPEPIPIDVKVVLVGDRRTYYLLKQLDPEFDSYFKIAADFEDAVDADEHNLAQFARLVATLAREHRLLPLQRGAVERVVEHAGRLAGDTQKLSADVHAIADLLQQADHLSHLAGHPTIDRADVDAALQARIVRAARLHRTLHEAILRDTLFVSTDGVQVGQINGLAYVDLGGYAFAHPVRITATARVGDGGVLDIERESELGGPLHSKGVMILSNLLAARYARRQLLSLSASLVFEQSYGPVEGDSASLAELCALLSALAQVPINQAFAVTGSVDQHGRVQPIGGVNEKIEGFFDICQARGLTGSQGVLIPAANLPHLMLREDVVQAAAKGQFHVHAVASVDAAIELLTGLAAGEADAQGSFPDGTLNQRVAAQLDTLSELRRRFGSRTERDR